jgi:hypothetical protein
LSISTALYRPASLRSLAVLTFCHFALFSMISWVRSFISDHSFQLWQGDPRMDSAEVKPWGTPAGSAFNSSAFRRVNSSNTGRRLPTLYSQLSFPFNNILASFLDF